MLQKVEATGNNNNNKIIMNCNEFEMNNVNYNIGDIDMDKECSMHGEKNSIYTVLVVKPEGK
jgi:hypothetical protein